MDRKTGRPLYADGHSTTTAPPGHACCLIGTYHRSWCVDSSLCRWTTPTSTSSSVSTSEIRRTSAAWSWIAEACRHPGRAAPQGAALAARRRPLRLRSHVFLTIHKWGAHAACSADGGGNHISLLRGSRQRCDGARRGGIAGAGEGGVEPPRATLGVKVMSMDLLLPSDAAPLTWEATTQAEAHTWRGTMEANALRLGDLTRFDTPRQLMSYLGLPPPASTRAASAAGSAASPRAATATPVGS